MSFAYPLVDPIFDLTIASRDLYSRDIILHIVRWRYDRAEMKIVCHVLKIEHTFCFSVSFTCLLQEVNNVMAAKE